MCTPRVAFLDTAGRAWHSMVSGKGSPRQGGRAWQRATRDLALILTVAAAAWCAACLHSLATTPACLSMDDGRSRALEGSPAGRAGQVQLSQARQPVRACGRTLVLYAYGGSDPEYPANLKFFLEEAVKVRGLNRASLYRVRSATVATRPWRKLSRGSPEAAFDGAVARAPPVHHGLQDDDGCDYLIVLQQGEGVAPLGPLPALPRNARFVRHPNQCYDWGTWGWALDSHVQRLEDYQFFVFLNPSVRPPALKKKD